MPRHAIPGQGAERVVISGSVAHQDGGLSARCDAHSTTAPAPRSKGRRNIRNHLGAAQTIPAVEALVAGAVADGDVAALVAEGGVAHHAGELDIEG
jgi:hypothetical protein